MKPYLLTILLSILTFISCNKDKESDTPASVVPKIKIVSNPAQPANQFTYEYDNQGRVTKSNFLNLETKTVYTAGQIVSTTTNTTTNMVDNSETITLDNKGLAIKKTTSLNPNLETLYEYNATSYLLNEKTRNISSGLITGEKKYYYTNNNLDSIGIYNNGGQYYGRNEFEYTTNTQNTIDYQNYGVNYFGIQQPKAIKKFIFKFGQLLWQTQNYTYQSDAQGRITSVATENISHSSTPPVTTNSNSNYTYH